MNRSATIKCILFSGLTIFIWQCITSSRHLLVAQVSDETGSTTDIRQLRNEILDVKQALARLREQRVSSPPIGSILLIAAVDVPEGYLPCDGRQLRRDDYPELFRVIGTTWGNGDEPASFQLPDLRGEFLRIFDAGRGLDPNRAFAEAQSFATALPTGAPFVTNESGDHVHSIDTSPESNPAINANGQHSHSIGPDGDHSHEIEIDVGDFGGEIDSVGLVPMTRNGTKKLVTNPSGLHRHSARENGFHAHTILHYERFVHNAGKSGQHEHNIASGGDAETRPHNQTLAAFIKY